MDVTMSENPPTVAEYIALRARAGWGVIDEAAATQTLQAATFTACLRQGKRLIGLARVMGDGALYLLLADLIVDPAFRGGGHGERLMQAVTDYYRRTAKPGATITLVAMKDRESFYQRFGFVPCPDGPFGSGMHFAAAPPPA